jgi:alginate O-acetyltransferase complex protein AlgJ
MDMAGKSSVGIRKVFDIAICLGFVAAIWLPLAASLLGIGHERRLMEDRPERMPAISTDLKALAAFPKEFEAYYNENFGLRQSLISWLNSLRSRIPGAVVANEVLVGQHGWYYYSAEDNIEDYRGQIKFTEAELKRMADKIEERRRWLAAFGCRYLLVIVPTKWEIYPEFMPANINRASTESRLDQVVVYLRKHSSVDFLELRTVLLEEKAKDGRLLYHSTDTHWNQLGAFIAVREISRKLAEWFPGIESESLDDYTVQETSETSGNLERMMGLNDLEHTVYIMQNKKARPVVDAGKIDWIDSPNTVYLQDGDRELPSTIFFHDSSGDKLRDFLPRTFSRCLFVSEPMLNAAIVERERPDVVIEEIGQRTLAKRLSSNPVGVAGFVSSAAGKSFEVHYPAGVKRVAFTIAARSLTEGGQWISLKVNGKAAGRWRIGSERQRLEADIGKYASAGPATVLNFGYSFTPAKPLTHKGTALPFRMRVESGGEDPNHCFVGVNGAGLSRFKGYNAYRFDDSGVLLERATFNTSWSREASEKFALFLRKNRRGEGYLLVVSRYLAGRDLTALAVRQLERLGCQADLQQNPSWNHIALIDLSDGRLIDEKFGPGRQVLDIGGFDNRAGFSISDIRIEPEPPPPID